METTHPDRFVRLPTELLGALLHARLSGTQWRILLWVIRQTYGWNRSTTAFSWYQIAKELFLDRGGVFRAGNRLLGGGILYAQAGRIGIQNDCGQWAAGIRPRNDDAGHLWITGTPAMTGIIATDGARHRKRCQASSLFRRAKDRCKDKKTVVVGVPAVDNHGERRIYEGADQRPTPVELVMDHYIALQGKALTKNQTAAFYRRFRKSAPALLEAYGGDVQAAKDALTRAGRRLDGRLTIPNVTS